MTQVMTEDTIATLGAATEASLQHTYERASKKKNSPVNMESFIEHVIDRGIAEIERTWKSAEKTEERNKTAKVATAQYNYLRLKQQHGDGLSEAEQKFLDLFKGIL